MYGEDSYLLILSMIWDMTNTMLMIWQLQPLACDSHFSWFICIYVVLVVDSVVVVFLWIMYGTSFQADWSKMNLGWPVLLFYGEGRG